MLQHVCPYFYEEQCLFMVLKRKRSEYIHTTANAFTLCGDSRKLASLFPIGDQNTKSGDNAGLLHDVPSQNTTQTGTRDQGQQALSQRLLPWMIAFSKASFNLTHRPAAIIFTFLKA